MDVSARVAEMQTQVEPLELFLDILADSLDGPVLRQTGTVWGYRYATPDERHFCLLKGVRAVSAFNAALHLCRAGFSQEICVLVRTIIECTSHVDYVLAHDGPLSNQAKEFVATYFSDIERDPAAPFKPIDLRQGAIHKSVGASLDKFVEGYQEGDQYKGIDTSKLYSSVYRAFSNYVHCKYPETMDLYGGRPEKFHLRGMSRTPKDSENVSVLETYLTTISQCLQLVVLRLNLYALIGGNQKLDAWIRSRP